MGSHGFESPQRWGFFRLQPAPTHSWVCYGLNGKTATIHSRTIYFTNAILSVARISWPWLHVLAYLRPGCCRDMIKRKAALSHSLKCSRVSIASSSSIIARKENCLWFGCPCCPGVIVIVWFLFGFMPVMSSCQSLQCLETHGGFVTGEVTGGDSYHPWAGVSLSDSVSTSKQLLGGLVSGVLHMLDQNRLRHHWMPLTWPSRSLGPPLVGGFLAA